MAVPGLRMVTTSRPESPRRMRPRLSSKPGVTSAPGSERCTLRSTLTWMRTMFAIVPLAVGVRNDDERHDLGHEIAQLANTFGAPYQVRICNPISRMP